MKADIELWDVLNVAKQYCDCDSFENLLQKFNARGDVLREIPDTGEYEIFDVRGVLIGWTFQQHEDTINLFPRLSTALKGR